MNESIKEVDHVKWKLDWKGRKRDHSAIVQLLPAVSLSLSSFSLFISYFSYALIYFTFSSPRPASKKKKDFDIIKILFSLFPLCFFCSFGCRAFLHIGSGENAALDRHRTRVPSLFLNSVTPSSTKRITIASQRQAQANAKPSHTR